MEDGGGRVGAPTLIACDLTTRGGDPETSLGDEERRARARERATVVRARVDAEYVRAFGERIRALYPGCPAPDADAIAAHACQKHNGRVGRSASARVFDPHAIALAVTAHVRHRHSDYDKLLAGGWDREDARRVVEGVVEEVLARWRAGRS